MAWEDVPLDHFDGGHNLTQGHKDAGGEGPLLSELFRRIKTGSLTAAGAGDEVVAFTEDFADTSYKVFLSSDTVAAAPVWKTGTKAVGGFTITVAAAGDVDWIAVHD